MQRPPEYPDSERPEADEDDDLIDKVYGPSQHDIDRAWDDYETGEGRPGRNFRGLVWKAAIVVVSLVILASMSIGIIGPLFDGSDSPRQTTPTRVDATVLRVIDGRTIVVDSGDGERTIRLIGVESPEFGNPFHDFAQEVAESWISGKTVQLEADQQEGDEQGRLMRYVFFDEVMINAALILNGLGKAQTVHPNVRYDGFLAEMERQARESQVGIWDPRYSDVDPDQTQAQGLSDVAIATDSAVN
jgi:endonuclease YncB( thermonuclease family)